MSAIDLSTSVSNAKSGTKPQKKKKYTKDSVPMVHLNRTGKNEVYGDYNYIDEMEAESSKIAKLEMWIAKGIGTELVNRYPKREWGVQVNVIDGYIVITCPALSTEKGYYLHMKGEALHELAQRAVHAAGEILERYGLSRERKFDPDIVETLNRDFKDQVVSSDAKAPEEK